MIYEAMVHPNDSYTNVIFCVADWKKKILDACKMLPPGGMFHSCVGRVIMFQS